MTAVEVLHTLQTRDIQLTVDGNQLRYDAPESAITDEVLTLLRQHKTALLVLLQQGHTSTPDPIAEETEASLNTPALTVPTFVTPLGSEVLPTPTGAWRCHCCHGTRRWRSVYGAVVCVRCHPPASPTLVAGWEGIPLEKTLNIHEGER